MIFKFLCFQMQKNGILELDGEGRGQPQNRPARPQWPPRGFSLDSEAILELGRGLSTNSEDTAITVNEAEDETEAAEKVVEPEVDGDGDGQVETFEQEEQLSPLKVPVRFFSCLDI